MFQTDIHRCYHYCLITRAISSFSAKCGTALMLVISYGIEYALKFPPWCNERDLKIHNLALASHQNLVGSIWALRNIRLFVLLGKNSLFQTFQKPIIWKSCVSKGLMIIYQILKGLKGKKAQILNKFEALKGPNQSYPSFTPADPIPLLTLVIHKCKLTNN